MRKEYVHPKLTIELFGDEDIIYCSWGVDDGSGNDYGDDEIITPPGDSGEG